VSVACFCGPYVWSVEWFVGAGGVADHDDDVVLNGYCGEYVFVVWVFGEEFFPALFVDFSGVACERVI